MAKILKIHRDAKLIRVFNLNNIQEVCRWGREIHFDNMGNTYYTCETEEMSYSHFCAISSFMSDENKVLNLDINKL